MIFYTNGDRTYFFKCNTHLQSVTVTARITRNYPSRDNRLDDYTQNKDLIKSKKIIFLNDFF